MAFPEHSSVVSAIVVSHNEGAWLRKTVNSLAGTIPPGGEILVVDDNSTDGSVDRLLPQNRVSILRPKRRLGAARARNFGLAMLGDAFSYFATHISKRRNAGSRLSGQLSPARASDWLVRLQRK